MNRFVLAFFLLFSSSCFAGDAEDILSVLQANFDACNNEDGAALLDTCSKDMPDPEGFRRESERLWREKDIHYSLVDFKLLRVDGNLAVAEIVQKTHSTDRSHGNEGDRFYRNGTTLLPDSEIVRYRAAFKKDFGKWKCYLTISQPVPVEN